MTAVLAAAVFFQLTFGGTAPSAAPAEPAEVNGPDEGVDGQGGEEVPLLAAPVQIVRVLVAAPVQIVRLRSDDAGGAVAAAPVEIVRVPTATTTALAPDESNESPLPGAPSLPKLP
jgi:hypothetical protein